MRGFHGVRRSTKRLLEAIFMSDVMNSRSYVVARCSLQRLADTVVVKVGQIWRREIRSCKQATDPTVNKNQSRAKH